MDTSNPVVRYMHFVILARHEGLEGKWPTLMLRNHDHTPKDEFAREVFGELIDKGYMTSEAFGVSFRAGVRYTVTAAGKEYFLALDGQKPTSGG